MRDRSVRRKSRRHRCALSAADEQLEEEDLLSGPCIAIEATVGLLTPLLTTWKKADGITVWTPSRSTVKDNGAERG
jgi:hypothetical protein